MPYTPTTWVDGATPSLDAANLNHIEQGVAAALRSDTVTTKGDLLVATGNGAVARLGVGSAGQELVPNQGLAVGLRWRDKPYVDIRDFGAVGDGVTDCTTAIQNAINSLPLNTASTGILTPNGFANGGTVRIPRGRYKVTGTISLQRGVRIQGESREGSQIISFTPGSVLQYLDAGRAVPDEIVVEDLSIWQDSSVVATSGAGIEVNIGTASVQSTNLIARNLIIESTYDGILLAAGICANVDTVFIGSVVSNGIEITPTASVIPTTSTTFRNCYPSSCGGSGFYINGAAYISLVGCASDSNTQYGYYLQGGNTYTLLGCGAEQNSVGGAYLTNTTGCVLNLSVVTTTTGVTRHGVTLNACNGTVLLGGEYNASSTTGYGIHVTANGGPITAIGAAFVGNYAGANVCDSASKFLNLTDTGGLVGSSGNWAIGVAATPDVNSLFQVGGTTAGTAGFKANAAFSANSATGYNAAAQVHAQTSGASIAYSALYGLYVENPTKGTGDTSSRVVGVAIDEQIAGLNGNADIYISTGSALPLGSWALYSASTRDSVFAGPIRSGSGTGPKWSSGTGSPEGVVTAPVGSMYSRTDGGASTTLYVKESGTGNTGWIAK